MAKDSEDGQIQSLQVSLCDMYSNLAFQEILEMDYGKL